MGQRQLRTWCQYAVGMKNLFQNNKLNILLILTLTVAVENMLYLNTLGRLTVTDFLSLDKLRDAGILTIGSYTHLVIPFSIILQNLSSMLLLFLVGVFMARKTELNLFQITVFFSLLLITNPIRVIMSYTYLSVHPNFSLILFIETLIICVVLLPISGIMGYKIGKKS